MHIITALRDLRVHRRVTNRFSAQTKETFGPGHGQPTTSARIGVGAAPSKKLHTIVILCHQNTKRMQPSEHCQGEGHWQSHSLQTFFLNTCEAVAPMYLPSGKGHWDTLPEGLDRQMATFKSSVMNCSHHWAQTKQRHIVCQQLLQQPFSNSGRAYAITSAHRLGGDAPLCSELRTSTRAASRSPGPGGHVRIPNTHTHTHTHAHTHTDTQTRGQFSCHEVMTHTKPARWHHGSTKTCKPGL